MLLRSTYDRPDPDGERRIFDLVGPKGLPEAGDDFTAKLEAERLDSGDYDDQQDQHDEGEYGALARLWELSPEQLGKVIGLVERLLDDEPEEPLVSGCSAKC